MHEFLVRHQAAIGAPAGVIVLGCLLLLVVGKRRLPLLLMFVVMFAVLAISPYLGVMVLGAVLS